MILFQLCLKIQITKKVDIFISVQFSCKFFGSIHLRLEMPHDQIAPLSVLFAFQSICILSLIYLHKKIERFSCCGQSSLYHCQWCTTLSCKLQPPFGVQKVGLESLDLELKHFVNYYALSDNVHILTSLPTFPK